MKNQNFEKQLPDGYRQALYINAKAPRFGIIFNLISVVVLILVMAVASISVSFDSVRITDVGFPRFWIEWMIFMVAMLAYIVLHELVHGAAYRALTGEKLTFGLSWSCAFCGVPEIYTYRKTALISVAAPLIVFTVILIPVTVWLYFVNPLYYFASAFLLGLHLGGCSGDIYVMLLLLFRFKGKKTLMRDTGPEQFFYTCE